MESRDQPGDERERDAVHDQDEQSQGQDGERQGEKKQNRPDQRIDRAKHQRGDDQRARAGDHDAGEELIGDPQPQGGDQQSDKESSHGAEDNRCARPATNRAVIPGRACTPSLESRRIEPLSESRPDGESETPANGPTSAGQPLTIACSGWPNQFTANVSARGARNTSRPRNRHSRSMTIVALSRMTSPRRKRSLMEGASGQVSVSPRATTKQRGTTRRIDFMARNVNNLPYGCNSTSPRWETPCAVC